LASVGDLIAKVQPDQWSAPTPCTDWAVRQLVHHLIGMNRVFSALLAGEPRPRRDADHVEDDPLTAYHDSATTLKSAFAKPGVLELSYHGPLGAATAAERLQIRLYDLLAHGWDLAQATGQRAVLPDDVAEQSLAFVRTHLTEQARPGRFGPAQMIADHAHLRADERTGTSRAESAKLHQQNEVHIVGRTRRARAGRDNRCPQRARQAE